MDSIHIIGGTPLYGRLSIQGSKNASLPVLAATALVKGTSKIYNCPDISDVACMLKLLESVGCKVDKSENYISVDARQLNNSLLPSEYVTAMRSSVMLMGPLLGRVGNVSMEYPGGCIIGKRPIDIHLKCFSKMGVMIRGTEERIIADASSLYATRVPLSFPSVGATENSVMLAVATPGTTVITNAALEPEITTLCRFLNAAGANIVQKQNGEIIVQGGVELQETEFTIPSDRIVAGTYLLACQGTKGEIELLNAPQEDLSALYPVLRQMGSEVDLVENAIRMRCNKATKAVPYTHTQVFPGFPTDLQSQLMATLSTAQGISMIEESIFEDRFRVVSALNKMGASITTAENLAIIDGRLHLKGSIVTAEELRGGAALVIAGLCAEGTTIVHNKHFIDRGYVDICKDLTQLGAQISSS